MAPAKSQSKVRGRKQKVEQCKKENEETRTKKGKKSGRKVGVSRGTNEKEPGRKKGKGGQEQVKEVNKVSKGKTKKDEEKTGTTDQAEESEHEENESLRRISRGRRQNGRSLSANVKTSESPVKTGKDVKSTSRTKATRKIPGNARRQDRRMDSSEEDESNTENENSEQQTEESSKEEKEAESEYAEETAETQERKVISEEDVSDPDNKTQEEVDTEKDIREEDVDEHSDSEDNEEHAEEPVAIAEDTESQVVVFETVEDKQEETSTPSKKPRPFNLSSRLQGQTEIPKSKMLCKNDPALAEKPNKNAEPSEEVQNKRMTRKSEAVKGKTQILQMTSKTKTMKKKDVQKEEETLALSEGPSGIQHSQSSRSFTMKDSDSDDENKTAPQENQSMDELNGKIIEK
ncbi:uncharacterized protein LOC143509619, partial [Brachyhypopomus gauderio]|uniref:uncharacterized protein LOC143509619 n=1 Tax=Brachyhypopomus gauderio TaxID=698409 RepID=UPI0040430134